jgi:hypothetical protein
MGRLLVAAAPYARAEDTKTWLIRSMYATAQKCPDINGILEELFSVKKFSREYMLI